MADDEFDSPFSHVPVSGAGPVPMQEGPFTYEKVVASTGSGGYAARAPRWVQVALIVVAAVLLLGLVAAVLR